MVIEIPVVIKGMDTCLRTRLLPFIAKNTEGEISTSLVDALIKQESQWSAKAVSHTGNRGLMQLTGTTVRELTVRQGVKIHGSYLHPENQITLGVSYLKYLHSRVSTRFPHLTAKQRLGITLHCYNAGYTATVRAVDRGG